MSCADYAHEYSDFSPGFDDVPDPAECPHCAWHGPWERLVVEWGARCCPACGCIVEDLRGEDAPPYPEPPVSVDTDLPF